MHDIPYTRGTFHNDPWVFRKDFAVLQQQAFSFWFEGSILNLLIKSRIRIIHFICQSIQENYIYLLFRENISPSGRKGKRENQISSTLENQTRTNVRKLNKDQTISVPRMKITVKEVSGSKFELDGVTPESTIKDVKGLIKNIKGWEPAAQILVLSGKTLSDDAKTLAECVGYVVHHSISFS